MKPLLLCALLLLPVSAGAMPYTASVALNLNTLTFSRPVELIPRSQQQIVNVLDLDTRCFSDPGCTDRTLFTQSQNWAFLTRWEDLSTARALAPVGSASSFAEPARLGGSVILDGPGFIQSWLDRNAFVVVMESGPLTISIDYAITHVGAPADSDLSGTGAFSGVGWTQLLLADHTGAFEVNHGQFVALAGDSSAVGTLTVTQFLTAGQFNFLTLATSAEAQAPRQSVPEPSTWLLLVGGLMALASIRVVLSRR